MLCEFISVVYIVDQFIINGSMATEGAIVNRR